MGNIITRRREYGKYISAFNEIDLLMEGLFERLNIGIGEINAYPSEDMFRIIVNKTEVESLKSINEMFAKNYFRKLIGL
ncbi:hypothetical protein [Klebsiella pneumoniae]|uniref:hypothetical protein n=1 Tax=Klebsiella pneumoniae TaxID=573 RepID=UPI001E2B3EBC|nr:hypothetical protein [Klebsiella pneumoniae]